MLLGLCMTLLAVVIVVFIGKLCYMYVQRWHAEERQKTHRAQIKESEESLKASKKVAESRIQRARLEADAVQAERDAQERMGGPRREMEKLRTEIGELKKALAEREVAIAERDKVADGLRCEAKNLKDKLEIEERHRRNAMLQTEDLTKQLNEAIAESETYKQRLEQASPPIDDVPAPAARRPTTGSLGGKPASGPRRPASNPPLAQSTPTPADPVPPTPAAAATPPAQRPASNPVVAPGLASAATNPPARPRPRSANDTLEDVEGPPIETVAGSDVVETSAASGEDLIADANSPPPPDRLPGRSDGF